MRPVLYVAGPHSDDDPNQVANNIAAASRAGREAMAKGWAPIVPHNNTLGWGNDFRFGWANFVDADIAILDRCDAVVFIGDYTRSKGCQWEFNRAESNGQPIFVGVESVPPAEEFEPDCVGELIDELRGRRRLGVSKYGRSLRPFNGRDARRDAYEELMDWALYTLQEQMER